MKKIILGLALVINLNAGWKNGNALVKDMEEYKKGISGKSSLLISEGSWYGYINGVRDILIDAGYICISENVTGKQTFEIVRKYIEKNPAEWHKSASYLTSKPLINAFPCRNKK